jgi:hypothetical protein
MTRFRKLHLIVLAPAKPEPFLCPGRDAALFALLCRTGTVPNTGVRYGAGSAAHHAAKSHSASKTRVNALMVLRCVRGTKHCSASRKIPAKALLATPVQLCILRLALNPTAQKAARHKDCLSLGQHLREDEHAHPRLE